ncbi:MAG: DHHA1 domain-containing protein, partial [Sulfobacillus sp.]
AGGVLALVSNHEQRVPMVVAVDQQGQDGGLDARQLIAVIGQQVEGRGGGRLDWAQGSGQRPDGIGAAVDSLIEAVRHRLS